MSISELADYTSSCRGLPSVSTGRLGLVWGPDCRRQKAKVLANHGLPDPSPLPPPRARSPSCLGQLPTNRSPPPLDCPSTRSSTPASDTLHPHFVCPAPPVHFRHIARSRLRTVTLAIYREILGRWHGGVSLRTDLAGLLEVTRSGSRDRARWTWSAFGRSCFHLGGVGDDRTRIHITTIHLIPNK